MLSQIRTYIAMDYDNDSSYYNLMRAWKAKDNINFSFYNVHDLNTIRPWSTEESKKQALQERMRECELFILLVGNRTRYQRMYVSWEIEQAVKRDLPIIVSNLNGHKYHDEEICPSRLANELAIHTNFGKDIIAYSMEHWPTLHKQFKNTGEIGPRRWNDSVYEQITQTLRFSDGRTVF